MKTKSLVVWSILALVFTACGDTNEQEAIREEASTDQKQAADVPEKPEGVSQEEWNAQLEFAEENPDTPMSDPLDAMPTSYPTDAEYYFFGDGRVVGKFSIPTEPSDEVSEVLTTLAPSQDASFIKVTLDNREGESQYSVDTITGYDADGKEYSFEEFGAMMSGPLWEMWENIDLYDDAQMQLHDDMEDLVYDFDNVVVPGAVKAVWLITQSEVLPEKFARLGVNGGGSYMGGSDPLPVEMAEFDLDFEAPTN